MLAIHFTIIRQVIPTIKGQELRKSKAILTLVDVHAEKSRRSLESMDDGFNGVHCW
jgi:hypothetical protein